MTYRFNDRFTYRGRGGCACVCKLEVIPLEDGGTVAIATEVIDNPGTSVTNVAEHLASFVCDKFGIPPAKLVWIEHYAYAGFGQPRTWDAVTFERRPASRPPPRSSPYRIGVQPDGFPGHFLRAEWRPMSAADWQALGLEPREPKTYASTPIAKAPAVAPLPATADVPDQLFLFDTAAASRSALGGGR